MPGDTPNSGKGGVILIIADLGGGGAQQVVSQLANAWAEQGRRVAVLTMAGADSDFFELSHGVERITVGGITSSSSLKEKLFNNFQRVKEIRTALQRFAGETVISFIAPMNVITLIASRGLNYRVIISERNDPGRQSFGLVWDGLRRFLYTQADLVTANSKEAVKTLGAYVPLKKLVFLPNPLRQPACSKAKSIGRERIILNVGRLHHQKGQDILIKAFSLVAKDLPEWRLCILGEGEEREKLVNLIGDLSLEKRVLLVGRVADPFEWYYRAMIFAFPSRWEGMPNALMEAMSCGLPCIVCDMSPGAVDLVAPDNAGLVVEGESPERLAESLLLLANNDRLRIELGQKARERTRSMAPEIVLRDWEQAVFGVL